jgi:hypothetical protein
VSGVQYLAHSFVLNNCLIHTADIIQCVPPGRTPGIRMLSIKSKYIFGSSFPISKSNR